MKQEQVNLAFRNEMRNGIENLKLLKFRGCKDDSLVNQVHDAFVVDLEGEQFIDQGVGAEDGFFKGVDHGIFLKKFHLS